MPAKPVRSTSADSRPARKAAPAAPRAPARVARADGADTRRHILEVAGAVIAERGAARATAKEICQRAGTHLAAVNYHFGGRDGLYAEVLVEAHRQLVDLDDLQRLVASPVGPRERLERLLRMLLERVARTRQPWGLKVLVQEFLAPSPQVPALIRRAIAPKAPLVFGIVAGALGVPPDDPRVQRAVVFAILPCMVLLVAPRALRRQVFPAVDADPSALVEDLVAYAMAGVEALRQRAASVSSR